MITKYDKEQKEQVGKTTYYCALSALQKSVRRGDAVRAVNWAKVAWRLEPYRLFCRLWVILYEDCGRDLGALLAFYKYRGGYSNFEALVPLVMAMVNAKKSREACLLSYWLRDGKESSIMSEAVRGTVHERLLELKRDLQSRGLRAYDVWDYGIGDVNFDWTIELAERSAKFDNEKFYVGMPYWFQHDVFEDSPVFEECNQLTLHRGCIPLEAMDGHTRPGKVSFSVYLKYRKEYMQNELKVLCPGGMANDEVLNEYAFCHEGWKYRNHGKYLGFDLWTPFNKGHSHKLFGTYTEIARPDRADLYMRAVIPELNRVREWVLTNVFAEDTEKMICEYYKEEYA